MKPTVSNSSTLGKQKSRSFKPAMKEYKLIGVIGHGSFATVWLAQYLPVENREVRVAVKIVELVKSSDLNQLFTEISLMKRLYHPNILSVHTAFIPTGSTDLWLVMPWMKGGSLHDVLHNNPEFTHSGLQGDLPLVATIITGVLTGLSYLHKEGIIHRDLKGSNCFIYRTGDIKIGDFGESGFLIKGGFNRYKLQTLRGTPWFMAPEVVEDETAGYDYQCDIWSLGILILQLTFGKPPWAKENMFEVMKNILNKDPMKEYNWSDHDDMSSLKFICRGCLAKDTKIRATASSLQKHPFFKLAKTKEYVKKRILDRLKEVTVKKRTPPDYYNVDEVRNSHSFNFKGMSNVMEKELKPPKAETFEDYPSWRPDLDEKKEKKVMKSDQPLP